jgi:hypothetical protein
MTRDELDDEFRLLKSEHDALRAEHRVLERNPKDIPAHITHGERLHDHLSRLHKHMAARGMPVLSRTFLGDGTGGDE